MPETSADDRTCSLREHDYIGLPQASSCPTRKLITATDKAEGTFEETELRLDLGLGLRVTTGFAKRAAEGQPKESQASRHGLQSELSNALTLSDLGSSASRNWMKRPFSQTIVAVNADNDALRDRAPAPIWASSDARGPSWHPSVLETSLKGSSHVPLENASPAVANGAPPTKDRVVGWPPVRSYRKQALAKPAEFFVKVNMDGITVGRKVDLNAHNSYGSLQRALEEMFRPSISGTQAAPGQEHEVKYSLQASDPEFVLTYEDKDGDWMLVGDVPWSLFVSTVRRLRITRGGEATGSGSKVPEKTKIHVF